MPTPAPPRCEPCGPERSTRQRPPSSPTADSPSSTGSYCSNAHCSRAEPVDAIVRLRRPDCDAPGVVTSRRWRRSTSLRSRSDGRTTSIRCARSATRHRPRGVGWPASDAPIPAPSVSRSPASPDATGYLQRVAVRPDAQRLGIGRQLVDDAVEWLMRRGARRALVNTGVDNLAALRMYEQASFDRLDDELVVLEHRRTP